MTEEFKQYILDIIKHGREILNESNDFNCIITSYQIWYTQAEKLVECFIPHRVMEFREYYINAKSKKIFENYSINDYLSGYLFNFKMEDIKDLVYCKIANQISLVQSIPFFLDSKLNELYNELYENINKDEIATAKKLFRINLRACGCICGVILENKLKILLKKYLPNDNTKDRDLSISVINDKLKGVAYNNVEWRRIGTLSDIRNKCDHDKKGTKNESLLPTRDEIAFMIKEVEYFLKVLK